MGKSNIYVFLKSGASSAWINCWKTAFPESLIAAVVRFLQLTAGVIRANDTL